MFSLFISKFNEIAAHSSDPRIRELFLNIKNRPKVHDTLTSLINTVTLLYPYDWDELCNAMAATDQAAVEALRTLLNEAISRIFGMYAEKRHISPELGRLAYEFEAQAETKGRLKYLLFMLTEFRNETPWRVVERGPLRPLYHPLLLEGTVLFGTNRSADPDASFNGQYKRDILRDSMDFCLLHPDGSQKAVYSKPHNEIVRIVDVYKNIGCDINPALNDAFERFFSQSGGGQDHATAFSSVSLLSMFFSEHFFLSLNNNRKVVVTLTEGDPHTINIELGINVFHVRKKANEADVIAPAEIPLFEFLVKTNISILDGMRYEVLFFTRDNTQEKIFDTILDGYMDPRTDLNRKFYYAALVGNGNFMQEHYAAVALGRTPIKYPRGNEASEPNQTVTPLHYLFSNGHVWAFKQFVSTHFKDPYLNDSYGRLKDKKSKKRIEIYHQLWKELTAKDIRGNTPLHYAAMRGHFKLIEFIDTLYFRNFGYRGYCAQLEQCNNDGNTALHLAAQNGHKKIVYFLMDIYQKINVEIYPNNNSFRPAHLAARNGHLLRRLTKSMDPIHLLALKPSTTAQELTEFLHANPLCITKMTQFGETALHLAARNNLEVFQILFECRPDLLGVVDNDGNTPLHSAVRAGDVAIVRFILQNSAPEFNIFAKNKIAKSALEIAASREDTPCIKALYGHHIHRKVRDRFLLLESKRPALLNLPDAMVRLDLQPVESPLLGSNTARPEIMADVLRMAPEIKDQVTALLNCDKCIGFDLDAIEQRVSAWFPNMELYNLGWIVPTPGFIRENENTCTVYIVLRVDIIKPRVDSRGLLQGAFYNMPTFNGVYSPVFAVSFAHTFALDEQTRMLTTQTSAVLVDYTYRRYFSRELEASFFDIPEPDILTREAQIDACFKNANQHQLPRTLERFQLSETDLLQRITPEQIQQALQAARERYDESSYNYFMRLRDIQKRTSRQVDGDDPRQHSVRSTAAARVFARHVQPPESGPMRAGHTLQPSS